MVGWHHRLDGHESEQTLGDGEGQGGLACCSPCGRKESDMTQRLNNNNIYYMDASQKMKTIQEKMYNFRGSRVTETAGQGPSQTILQSPAS